MANKYQVWSCKIYVPIDTELPNGFDWPPRRAAIEAVDNAGIEVVACSSGWGCPSTDKEEEIIKGQGNG